MGAVIALGVGSVRGQNSNRTPVAALPAAEHQGESPTVTLDLREPMQLAARAIARRLDPAEEFRPWFLLRGRGGVPVAPEHANWDLGDMTGRYLEGLILARHIAAPMRCNG